MCSYATANVVRELFWSLSRWVLERLGLGYHLTNKDRTRGVDLPT